MLATLFVAVPAPVAEALWVPPPPVGDYTPRHVSQRRDNCVWAAGQMLLDKWTHGDVRVDQGRLRRMARDRKGGSTLVDLARGVARTTGIKLRFSPGFGDSMAWWQLLDRLEHDGGAVLLGEYGRLPDHYTRWSPRFAARRNSGHAVYVERYDRARGRVWLMDPLDSGDHPGEWIGVDALRRFATVDGDLVMAAATPARHEPRTAPLTDHAYRLGPPQVPTIAISGSTVPVRVRLSIAGGFPKPAAHRFIARWDPIVEPPASVTAKPRVTTDSDRASETADPPEPTLAHTASAPDRAGGDGFAASLPVPATPGRYRVTIGLAEPGRETASRELAPVEVEVLGPYAASWAVPAGVEVIAESPFSLKVAITNIGTVDWRPAPGALEDPRPPDGVQTVLVLTWRSPAGRQIPAAEVPVELAPGETAHLQVELGAPPDAGPWQLLADIVNVAHGSLAATGQDLPVVAVEVVPQVLSAGP